MKKTIIYLGIAATLSINSLSANKIEEQQQNQENDFATTTVVAPVILVKKESVKPTIPVESMSSITKSIAAISSNFKKTAEAVIQEDKEIIESTTNTDQPLHIGFTIEEIIQIDNQIIDYSISNEVYPLRLDLINANANLSKNKEFAD